MGHRSIPSKVFVLLYCVVSAYLTNLSQCVARGKGCYELQSRYTAHFALLIYCVWTDSILPLSTYWAQVLPLSYIYFGLTERLPYWTSISFLIKGCDCLAFILFQVCSLYTNRVILPTRPAVWDGNLLCLLTPTRHLVAYKQCFHTS